VGVTVSANSGQIADYYKKYLGREAAPVEIANWVGHANATGGDLETIRKGLANHQEAADYAAREAQRTEPPTTVPATVPTTTPAEPDKKEDGRLEELMNTVNGYAARFDAFTNTYNTALSQSGELRDRNNALNSRVQELEGDLAATTAEYDSTKNELQGFRDRESGEQLARLRSGGSSGGGSYSSAGGDIAAGAPVYQSSNSRTGAQVKVDASDSVISGGSGVTQLSGGSQRAGRSNSSARVSAVSRARNRLASGGSSLQQYYSSRFE
jgi:hypothetical protein